MLLNFMVMTFLLANLMKMNGASKKIVALMQDKCDIQTRGGTTVPADSNKGQIEFRDVNFHYPSKPDVQVS